MKKIISLILAVLLGSVCFLAVGCTGEKDKNTVVISRWASITEEENFRTWTEAFQKDNPDITIKWEFLPYAGHFDKLRTDLIAERAGDIIWMNCWGWEPYSDIDIFEDLSKVDELKETISSIIPSAQNVFFEDGKLKGLPIGLVNRVPVVNLADFQAAGVEVPQQRDHAFESAELTNLLKEVCSKSGREMGININVTDVLYLLTASVGSPIITEDNKIGVNNEKGIAALNEFKEFMNSGYAVKLGQGGYGTTDEAIQTGRVVANYTGPYGFDILDGMGYQYQSIPTIKAKGGEDVMLADFNAIFVPSASNAKDAAYKVIKWMFSEEAQLEFAKFGDLPVNSKVFKTVTEEWDQSKYGCFKIGMDNMYISPSLSTDFQTLLGGQVKKFLDGNISAEVFCEELVENGEALL